jgi:beta-lactamase superfamily II metal-dependent hydrolase
MNEADTAITVECLPASYGDSILVTCNLEKSVAPKRTWRLLIDTGPDDCWPTVKARLGQIKPDARGVRHIDLAIISHIDHDHIGGAHLLFSEKTLGLEFGDVWFNAWQHFGERGVGEAIRLGQILAADDTLPWNRAFTGGAIVTPGDGGYVEVPTAPDLPKLTLLSPTPRRLTALAKVWDREAKKLAAKQSNTTVERGRRSEFPDLEALARHKSRGDRSAPNGSSIALLLEHRGTAVLLAADAFSTVLGSALVRLIQDRQVPHPVEVDAFKLSHHGSRANLLTKLLGVVRAEHYLISTNNSRYSHPNDEALARVVLYGGRRPRLWFNYHTPRNERWAAPNLCQKHGYLTTLPQDDTRGIRLALPARK